MALTPFLPNRHYHFATALLASLGSLSACSVYDFQQLATTAETALLIRQDDSHNALETALAKDLSSHLEGVQVDPKQLPVTASNSIAIKTQTDGGNLTTPIPPTATITVEQAQQQLIQYLADIEAQPERIEKLAAAAQALAERYPEDSLVQSLYQRLSRYSDWQPVHAISSSAGIDFVSINGWQPENPFIRTRRALLPPVADNEHVIFADQRLVLLFTNPNPVSLHVDARLDDVPYLPEHPATLVFQLDDGIPQRRQLVDKDNWRRLTVAIPAGEHAVRIYQEQPVGNQYIKLKFDDHLANLAVTQERPYFISTRDAPLAFYSQGPAVLRIDELDNGEASYRYQNVPEGWHTVSLPPSAGKARSLFRVSQRAVNLQPQPPKNRPTTRHVVPVPPALPEPITVTPNKVELVDVFKLGRQENGTYSPGFDLVRRNDKQSGGRILPEEQFAQYRLNYRYFDEPNAVYWNTQGLFRTREFGGPTFGLNESVYYNPNWLPFTISSEAKIFGQVPHDRMELLGQWDVAIAQAYKLHPKTSLIPSLSFFARTMTLHNSNLALNDTEFKKKLDQDIFTPYKAEHTAGLTPALSLVHKPWLDTIWSGKAGMGSNEDLDFTNPDHYSTEAHWLQLLDSVVLDASYRTTFYQADANRLHAQARSYAGLELNWQHWASHQNRFEIAAQYSYDLQRNNHLAMLSLTYHFGEGRGLRDFAPNEVPFRDIRQRQITDGQNNTLLNISDCSLPCPLP